MFNSLADLSAKLSATGYFIDPVMIQVVYLAEKLKKPLLLEGPAGSGKTFMALGTIHVLTAGQPSTTLVMCPSHITHKWAREVLLTVPRARTFLVEDMRNGGDPKKQHGICEVKLSKGKTVYEGKHLTLAEMRRMGRREWRKRFPGPVFFIIGKDKGKLGYFWDHAYLKAKSGPNLGSIVNPDSGLAILDSERQKLTHLDFDEKLKVSETLVSPKLGTTRFSALWQADRTRIQRMAPIEYIGRYMRGWFDFAIADELHQLAGDTAQGNGLGVLGRAAQRLIALTGTLMGGYAPLLVNSRPLERWLEHARIDWEHVDHLPSILGPGIMVTLPGGCGMPVIDGNHRGARALRDRHEFFAFVLGESETLELLRRSMGPSIADHYWKRMLQSKPHPGNVQEGEQ